LNREPAAVAGFKKKRHHCAAIAANLARAGRALKGFAQGKKRRSEARGGCDENFAAFFRVSSHL
jgi:hypothetical protein